MVRLAVPSWRFILLPLALLRSVASLRALTPDAKPPASGGEVTPKVFFLMLAYDRIFWEDIWVEFLSGGKLGENFEAFLHCTEHDACLANVAHQDIFRIVPTVPSEYCQNLIDPHLALLAAAMKNSKPGNPHDKFALVSHNSLPVKPFSYVHSYLTDHQENMAFFFQGHWRDKRCHLLKASQFSVVSWWHAQRMLAGGKSVSRDLGVIQCNASKGGCVDEFWALRAIYGEKALRVDPNHLPQYLNWNKKWMWVDFTHIGRHIEVLRRKGRVAGVAAQRSEGRRAGAAAHRPEGRDAGIAAHRSEGRFGGPFGPAAFTSISKAKLSEFRSMDGVCFARKFDMSTRFNGSMPLPEAFSKYVFNA